MLTPEQQKTIKAARLLSKRMWAEQLGPALKEYAEYQRELQSLLAPGMPRPSEPEEDDPAERQRLNEILAEASKKKEAAK